MYNLTFNSRSSNLFLSCVGHYVTSNGDYRKWDINMVFTYEDLHKFNVIHNLILQLIGP